MSTILDQIVAKKHQEVKVRQANASIDVLQQSPFFLTKVRSAKAAVIARDKTGIIAEFKRRSPSKGFINETADIQKVVKAYEAHGASVVSVLTDEDFFAGSSELFAQAKEVLTIPLLRKDFIVDPYQVYETKAMGADLMLLIAECLTRDEVYALAQLAHALGLEVLLELHSEDQLEKVNEYIDLVGINNRDLKTFAVDLEKSKQILSQLPTDLVKVAESGISNPAVVDELREAGFQGFLIGEEFMKHENPGDAFAAFVKKLTV